MSQIRKRTPDLPATDAGDAAPVTTVHRGADFKVESTLSLGVEPHLAYAWAVPEQFWKRGFRLLVFHNTSGFCADKETRDLSRHGQLIVEASEDGVREEQPTEGTHFYTFVLHKKNGWLGLTETLTEVRFSANVPSAKIGIGRVRDRVELEQLIRDHHLGQKQYELALAELRLRKLNVKRSFANAQPTTGQGEPGRSPVVDREIKRIDNLVEALHAKQEKLAAVQQDPRFEKLSAEDREVIIKTINDLLDVAEMSARSDGR